MTAHHAAHGIPLRRATAGRRSAGNATIHQINRAAAPAETSPLPSAEFADAFRGHAGGVAVITADAGDGPVGFTATSVTSISADPPLLAFSISDQSSSSPTVRQAESVVIHLLGSSQLDIARLCATSGVDRFADPSIWSRLNTGEPYFPAARTWLRGTIVDRVRAGTATVIIVEASHAGASESAAEETPLVYHSRTWHHLGEHSRVD